MKSSNAPEQDKLEACVKEEELIRRLIGFGITSLALMMITPAICKTFGQSMGWQGILISTICAGTIIYILVLARKAGLI